MLYQLKVCKEHIRSLYCDTVILHFGGDDLNTIRLKSRIVFNKKIIKYLSSRCGEHFLAYYPHFMSKKKNFDFPDYFPGRFTLLGKVIESKVKFRKILRTILDSFEALYELGLEEDDIEILQFKIAMMQILLGHNHETTEEMPLFLELDDEDDERERDSKTE